MFAGWILLIVRILLASYIIIAQRKKSSVTGYWVLCPLVSCWSHNSSLLAFNSVLLVDEIDQKAPSKSVNNYEMFFFSFIVVNNESQSVSVSSLSVLLTNPVTVIYSDLPNVLYTGWHAEVTKQHQAYGERAGLGEAEEVYWRFWSRRLIISLYSKIGLHLTTIFTLSYASDHLIRLFNCCVKNGGKCHRFNGPEVAANQSYSWQKNIYPFVTIIDLFFFFNQPTSWGIASFSHINLPIHRGLCLRYFFKGFSYYISNWSVLFFFWNCITVRKVCAKATVGRSWHPSITTYFM